MLNHPDLLDVMDSVAQQAVSPVHCKPLKFNYCIAAVPYETILHSYNVILYRLMHITLIISLLSVCGCSLYICMQVCIQWDLC